MRKPSINPSRVLSRRDFIAGASCATLAAGLDRVAFAAGSGKPQHKVVVGAMPWIYAATLPERDISPVLPQIFADYEHAGIENIELLNNVLLSAETLARIGELTTKHPVRVLGSSFGAQMFHRALHGQIIDEAARTIHGLARLGGRTLGTTVGRSREKKTEAQLDAQAEVLRRIMAIAKESGVVVNLHNHTYEVENDLHDLEGTLARVPDAKLGPDLGWLIRAKVDPVWFIETYADRIVFLHLRDQTKDGRWSEAMGEGDTDFGPIVRALHAIPFTGDAVIELAHERDFMPTRPLRESLKMSRAFVRRTFGY